MTHQHTLSSVILYLGLSLISFVNVSFAQLPVSSTASSNLEGVSPSDPRGHGAVGVVAGAVKSASKPVVGARVLVPGVDRVTYTDAKGKFSFPNVPNGSYTIFAHCMGYTSASRRVTVFSDTAEVGFSLHQTAIPVEGIVVSASPYAASAGEEYQPAESMSAVQLQDRSASSFSEALSDLPGVEVRYNGAAPTRPMIRGLGDNEVLVLEDGLRSGDVSTYDPAHAVPILPLSIEQIDVVRGPASIMFGPNAIGGLINIITNTIPRPSNRTFSGTASLAGNTVSSEYTGFFNGVYTNGGSAFGVTLGGLHTQDTQIPEGNYFDGIQNFQLNHLPHSFARSQEEGAGYSYQGGFGMIGIGYNHYEATYGIPGTPPNSNWQNDPPTTSLITQMKNLVELRGLWAVDDPFLRQLRLDANYVNYDHSEFPTLQDASGVSNPQANFFHKQTVNADLRFMTQQSSSFRGTVGLWGEVDRLNIEGQQPLGPNSTTSDLAAYIYEEYLLSNVTRFEGAVRYDVNSIQTQPYAASLDPVFQILDVSKTHGAVTASVGAVQNISSGLLTSLSIGRSFRAPTVQELFANGADAASNTYSIGDASLGPESGLEVDASLKGRFKSLSFEVSPFINFISHYIYAYLTGDTLENLPVRQFSATDARLWGYEVMATVEPVGNLALEASASYVNAEDTKNHIPLPFIPPLHGFLRLTYLKDMYSGHIQWNLAASQDRLGIGDTYTAGYGVVNVGVGMRIPSGGVVQNIGLHCDNLLNQLYRDNLSVIKDFLPMPGRAFRLSYNLMF